MMSNPSIPKEAIDAASRWVTLRDAGVMTDADEHALAEWLDADPLHPIALAKAENLWAELSDHRVRAALGHRYGAAVGQPTRGPRSAFRWIGPALAASLVLATVGSIEDWPTRLRADAMTATGERRTVLLADGSTAQLDTDSAIAIDYSGDRRTIHLLKGRAAFTVAPDRAHPFIVAAGDGSTTALGTRFIVGRAGDDTDVTVTEHRVRVSLSDPAGTSRIVTEGEAIRYSPGGVAPVHAVDPMAATAWTRGTLVFVDRPLAEVVAELNRYHPGYIRVVGADLAARRVSGGFPTDDPVAAIDTLQRTLGIRSTRFTDRLILLHR